MKKEKKTCDMCYKESGFNFRITEDAVFHACIDHVKALSDIIYPVGTALGVAKVPHLMKKLHAPEK